MFYAPSNGGFYDPDLHGDNIPADAILISKSEHQALMNAQGSGDLIVLDGNGRPTTQAPPEPPLEDRKLEALADFRSQLNTIRQQVVDAAPERFGGWLQKYFMAQLSSFSDELIVAGISAPTLVAAAGVALAGFQDEGDITNEAAADLMARTITRGNGLFRANQIVEGMERKAERDIPAAETQAALDAIISDLNAAKANAMSALMALTEGASNA